MSFSSADVKKLRELTGAGVMDCQKALTQAKGNFAKATELVRATGMARAEKKSDRETKVGYIGSYVHQNNQVAALVEVLCETDFVARNSDFQDMVKHLAMQVAAMAPADVTELMSQEFIKDPSITIEQMVKLVSGKIGERFVISRILRWQMGETLATAQPE